MTNTRRAVIDLDYMGVNISTELAPNLISFKYNDNEGKADDVQIDLEDRDRKWQKPWLPKKGDRIEASIKLINWRKEGEVSRLDCGTFYIDDVSFKGPPDTISIKGLSIPFPEGGKNAAQTRAWEDATLPTILGDVAKSAGLGLVYDAPVFLYDRVDQVRETDLAFAKRMAKKEGLAVKVTKSQLIIYSEVAYESKGTVRDIIRGQSDVISYSFNTTAAEEQYQKVEVSYMDNTKKKVVKYVYNVPGVEKGPTLKVNKRAKSIDEAMRWAKAEARAKNKGARTGKITLLGDENLVQGITVNVGNFGGFDGKYFIESCAHNVTGGYKVDISLREVLSY